MGFLDKRDGKFHELMMVQNQQELKDFCRKLGVEDIKTIY